MKKLLTINFPLSTLLFLLVGCSGGYELGDYYKTDGSAAIVVDVDANKQPSLLLSVEEASNLDADSAAAWAAALGNGWRLPDKNEMTKIVRLKILLNKTLKQKTLPEAFKDFTFYWTSTQCSETHTYAYGPNGVSCYYKENQDPSYKARAVKEIEN